MNSIGENLKRRRVHRGLTQEQLSKELTEKMDFPINAVTLSQYENDKRTPSIDFIIKTSLYFECTIDELVGIEKETSYETQLNDLKYIVLRKLINKIDNMNIEELVSFINDFQEYIKE